MIDIPVMLRAFTLPLSSKLTAPEVTPPQPRSILQRLELWPKTDLAYHILVTISRLVGRSTTNREKREDIPSMTTAKSEVLTAQTLLPGALLWVFSVMPEMKKNVTRLYLYYNCANHHARKTERRRGLQS